MAMSALDEATREVSVLLQTLGNPEQLQLGSCRSSRLRNPRAVGTDSGRAVVHVTTGVRAKPRPVEKDAEAPSVDRC